MIKRILVPLDTSEYSEAAVDYACGIAKQHDSTLTGIVVLNLFGLKKSLGRPGVGGIHYYKKLESFKIKEAQEHIETLKKNFASKCKKEGIKYTIDDEQGRPSSWILEDGRFHDLIVIGMKTHFRLGSAAETNSSSERIIESSVTPKYLVPAKKGLRQKHNKVLIIIDESQPSGRALQRYCQVGLPEATGKVRVIMASKKEKEGRESLERAKALLNAHNFTDVETVWCPNKLKDVLQDEQVDWADLIVKAPNHESDLIHFKFSNLTKFLIKLEKKPLFLG